MSSHSSDVPSPLSSWMRALESRHLSDLRVAEVTRALRALSSAYVERRHKVASGSTLDSKGKRAAFALYYGPLHFIAATHVLAELAPPAPPRQIVDLGAGTGVVGAAWALASRPSRPLLTAIDRHPWAVDEARRTYRDLGLTGQAQVGDLTRLPLPGTGLAYVAGYVLNELPEDLRVRVEERLLHGVTVGTRVLIMEPIARGVAPWWEATADRFRSVGGRADEWRFQPDVPDLVARLGQAAGLNYREVRLRTLFA